VALVPESAQEKAALLHGRWLRVFILVVILLGGFFAISYFGQPHSAPVEASATGRKVEPPATQPARVPLKEPITETAHIKTAVPHRVAGSTYLQLSAVRRQSAERLTDDLRKKNFAAVASEIDGKPGLFRVLVGPVSDTGVVQLRADLERAGFPGNAAIRRTSAESNPPKPDNAISWSARTTKEEASNRPVAGETYMELSAASRDSAQLLVDALRQKKFNAMASEIIEKPGMFRVLVGPVEDTGVGIAQMRADLEGAGFPGNAAIRRTSAESAPARPDPTSAGAVKSLSAGATKADDSNRPVAGQAYLEFSATSPQTAEIIADALHEKGFESIASETEDPPGGFHVLVRPVNNTSIDQLRADLERAGFHGNAAILRISK
jgi:cell division septation protein DedD